MAVISIVKASSSTQENRVSLLKRTSQGVDTQVFESKLPSILRHQNEPSSSSNEGDSRRARTAYRLSQARRHNWNQYQQIMLEIERYLNKLDLLVNG